VIGFPFTLTETSAADTAALIARDNVPAIAAVLVMVERRGIRTSER
jgi:hypothetical protein